MMKRLIPVATAAFLTTALSTPAFAHSELQSATPGDGETLTETTDKVTLTFGGQVEKGSTIEVTDAAGKTVEQEDLSVEGNQLTATFDEPLENSTYKVDWDIISGDGHTLAGEYSFTVDAPVDETADDDAEEAETTADEKEDTNTEETAKTDKADDNTTTEQEDTTADDVTGPSTSMLAAVFGGLIVVIGGGLFFLLRKK